MAAGYDARVAVSKETVYGTRVAPARFLPLTAEDFGFTPNRYQSPAIGIGAWGQPSIIVSKSGSGSLSGDVTTTGMGMLLNGLHPNTVTPVQQGGTTAYLQTHNLSGSPSGKSFSYQVQNPPVSSATLVPHDMLGVKYGGITLSWSGGGVLSYEIPVVYQSLDTAQSLVSFVAPASYELFSFQQGTLTIGGVAETNIIGDGSITFAWPLRDDAFALGTGGLIAEPVPTGKPSATGSYTADFNDNTNLTRTLNDTMANVILSFVGATISGTYKYTFRVNVPDCKFNTQRATVGDPGPLQQPVEFIASSATADVPSIDYISTDTTL